MTAKGLKIFKELALLDYLQLLISIMVNTFVVEMNLSSLIPHKIGFAHQYPGRKLSLHLPQRVLYKEITPSSDVKRVYSRTVDHRRVCIQCNNLNEFDCFIDNV